MDGRQFFVIRRVLEESGEEFLRESSCVHAHFFLSELAYEANVEARLDVAMIELSHGVLELSSAMDGNALTAVVMVVVRLSAY
jgi:hypothetical protein